MKQRTRSTSPRGGRTSLRGTRAEHGDAAETALAALQRHLKAGECFKSALELGTAWTQIDEGYRINLIPNLQPERIFQETQVDRPERYISEKRSDEQSKQFDKLADKFKQACLIRR
jgi:hypothetical protein